MLSVMKFGGTSVASATNISRMMDIVAERAASSRVILVLSAISGCTDALITVAEGAPDAAGEIKSRHLAIIRRLFTGEERLAAEKEFLELFGEMLSSPEEETVTYGELFSTRIVARKLSLEGYNTRWLDSRKLIIAHDDDATVTNIKAATEDSTVGIFVAPGFIAGTPEGGVTTLGRGGSDFSAAIYAAAVKADALQIWTDVPGFMTANPKTVVSARTIPEMSYEDALALASKGAKVLYAPTVAPAMESGIGIEIRNTFAPGGAYTLISGVHSSNTSGWIGLTSARHGDECVITLVGTPDGGTAARIGTCLAKAGIAPGAVDVSSREVAVTVPWALDVRTQEALHREFFELRGDAGTIDLYIAGYGAVGKALLGLLGSRAKDLAELTGKRIRVLGIGNSRGWLLDLDGLDVLEGSALSSASLASNGSQVSQVVLQTTPPATKMAQNVAGGASAGTTCDTRSTITTSPSFVDEVLRTAQEGALFIDCTDSETIYKRYPELFAKGVGVISSNRRSLAIPYVEYAALKEAARREGVSFRYETTVGAALPVLESIARGAAVGDEIISLEAVVSCTLNQIFGEYTGTGRSFSALLRKAAEEGLTEKDPRLDLGGRDALRKLLILAREAAIPLEEKDVEIRSLAPAPGEDLYEALEKMEPFFREELSPRDGLRPRFVALLEKTCGGYRASISVRHVDSRHPAYNLEGTENAIIIKSGYHPYPLVIQGAGEGAIQAASSILNDILR